MTWNKVMMLSVLLAGFANIAAAEDIAQTQESIEHDKQVIATDQIVINADDNAIHELDRQRNEALRLKNYPLASQLQASIDQKKASRAKTEEDLQHTQDRLSHQKHEEKEECEHNTQCDAEMKKRELTRKLDEARSKLAADEAAAARIPQDKVAISEIEKALQ